VSSALSVVVKGLVHGADTTGPVLAPVRVQVVVVPGSALKPQLGEVDGDGEAGVLVATGAAGAVRSST
jgi:hypothetical protein